MSDMSDVDDDDDDDDDDDNDDVVVARATSYKWVCMT